MKLKRVRKGRNALSDLSRSLNEISSDLNGAVFISRYTAT